MNAAHELSVDTILELAGLTPESCENALHGFFRMTPLARMQDRADLMLTAVTSEHEFYQSHGAISAAEENTGLGGITPLGSAYDGMLCLLD